MSTTKEGEDCVPSVEDGVEMKWKGCQVSLKTEKRSMAKPDLRRMHIIMDSSDKDVRFSVTKFPPMEKAVSLATEDACTANTSLESCAT